ncbi:MAG: AAA family ATPase [Halieaceae bacterium]|nr:AAA family ATPase [Halieaceae bacterium]
MPSERDLIRQIQHHATQLATAVAAAEFWHGRILDQEEKVQRDRLQAAEDQRQQAETKARQAYGQAVSRQKQRLMQAEAKHQSALQAAQSGYLTQWKQVEAGGQILSAQLDDHVAPWDSTFWQGWRPRPGPGAPELVRLGQLAMRGTYHTLTMPVFLPAIGSRSLLWNVNGQARKDAIPALQSLLLHFLAAIPPGKLRFTFLDPVGLGQNVAPFMHLADYDPQLVSARGWTEPRHIEQRLAELTEHIETVIQTYLRNEYATIKEYNEQAGEIAEPYRILVVFDFPTNFSEDAARRLLSIAQNGSRCGVYAVVLADTEKPMPHGFDLADLERASTVIAWDGERWVWDDEDFRDLTLELDAPPPPQLFSQIVKAVGEASLEAGNVEVPFERIAPSPEAWWQASSEEGMHVPLGPIGARRVQYLDLGQGTAQHALIAGRTGSGKSTLFHTLITGLAMTYSPDEVILYLVDFKKGVEFKGYATYELPHARVVAIESEREFGLSVLQGLDAELKRRGELFRAAGVDSIADYRKKNGKQMPRILLIVDEFQEFFTEDDRVAAATSQVLDRLVRQGRAFGVHVILGSQTLSGAYALSRSTMDQMAVRIALQCTEADSRLILADDNPAARLLSRPGEAIYNDANGLVEGNHPFQVAWLDDDEREAYLVRIRSFAQEQKYRPSQPQIVFEGNAPALAAKNRSLNGLLAAPTWPQAARRVSAWLGEPIASQTTLPLISPPERR